VQSAPHRVLVVDDNRPAADLMAMLISHMGHIVERAYDGPAALLAAGDLQPDIVLLDLVMPDMDGFAVARRLRDMSGLNQPKIVALSAFDQPAFVEATAAAGFDGHIGKPASTEAIAKLLAS
jgi:CheY-like chemotaxis protein